MLSYGLVCPTHSIIALSDLKHDMAMSHCMACDVLLYANAICK